jgi:hypothetical protein
MTRLLEDLPPVLATDRGEAVRSPSAVSSAGSTSVWARERTARVAVASAGVLPVGFIAVSAFGIVGLGELATLMAGPVLLGVVVLTGRSRPAWVLMARAVCAGIVATALYDLFRFSLLGLGVLDGDPIPHIGTALGLRPAWVFGYLWRYVGDGGGLAVTFFVLGFRGVRAGVLFGLAVCAGLLLTLLITPHGQEMLFPLTLNTVAMATIGHIIYGSVLGALATRVSLPPPLRG